MTCSGAPRGCHPPHHHAEIIDELKHDMLVAPLAGAILAGAILAGAIPPARPGYGCLLFCASRILRISSSSC